MNRRLLLLLLATLALWGCDGCSEDGSGEPDSGIDSGGDADGDADGDSDGDADGDSDGDADSDADSDADADTDGDADSDTDGDADSDTDTDADTGSEAENQWCDTSTGLCWQNPPSVESMNWYEATGAFNADYNPEGRDYCGSLEWGGYTDWRLPDVDEVISLLRGCVEGVATGDQSLSTCGVEDPGCTGWGCDSWPECAECAAGGGPGAGGCYRAAALGGSCSALWTSSVLSNDYNEEFAWYVSMPTALTFWFEKWFSSAVRCVRNG